MRAVFLLRNIMFQSTRPVRGATNGRDGAARGVDVSIHAPREGRDLMINSPLIFP